MLSSLLRNQPRSRPRRDGVGGGGWQLQRLEAGLELGIVERAQQRLTRRGRVQAADRLADIDHETQRVARREGEQIDRVVRADFGQQHRLVERVAQRAKQQIGPRHHGVVIADHLAEKSQPLRGIIAGARCQFVDIAARLHRLQHVVTARHRNALQPSDVRQGQRPLLLREQFQQVQNTLYGLRHASPIFALPKYNAA